MRRRGQYKFLYAAEVSRPFQYEVPFMRIKMFQAPKPAMMEKHLKHAY
jgi:hypothetical protein